MRGDTGPGVPVLIVVAEDRLRLTAGEELIGDWAVEDLGIHALQDGLAIRAQGEEFVLRSEDDALLVEELGMVAVSPRLARRVAALHPPEERPPPEPLPVEESRIDAIALALGGALVLAGGVFFRLFAIGSLAPQSAQPTDALYQWPFIVGGTVMVAAGVAMAADVSRARTVALVILALVVVTLGFALGDSRGDVAHLTAFGFIAGGVVVGVAALTGWDRILDQDG